MEPVNIINVHAHLFTKRNVPVNFLPAFLKPVSGWLANKKFATVSAWIFRNIFSQKSYAALIKKYHSFVRVANHKTQEDVLKDLIRQYPEGTKFCILTMDMEYMGAGPVPQSFTEQLNELASLKRDPRYRDIIYPFIFVHPERPNIFELVKHYIEVEGFAGIKLYPPLGYFPFDPRLGRVYEYAEKNGIPITSHCARGGVFYRGKITDDMRIHPITGKRLPRASNKDFCQNFTDPANYDYVFKKYPRLKVNFAHFAGGSEWEYAISKGKVSTLESWLAKIYELLITHPNVYADISYTAYDDKLHWFLSTILKDGRIRYKILFGSDFYMVEREIAEKQFFMKLRASLGENDFPIIAYVNPKVFLRFKK